MQEDTFFDEEFGQSDNDPDEQGSFEKDLVFVAMQFYDNEMQESYSAIKDECLKLGLKPKRVEDNIGSGFIIKEITALIEDAEFIIFDLTHERPNVYYELGYAHGVGNKSLDILLLAKEGTKIHFDIAPLRVKFYKTTEHLRSTVSSCLKEMIDITRGKK